MLGINYESSDEEDAVPAVKTNLTNTLAEDAPNPEPLVGPVPVEQPAAASILISGPSQGPTASPPPQDEGSMNNGPPGSPHTSNRAIIQNLTLPTVPCFAIPPSPPGSPPPRATKKFAQFLELKTKGQHFNQRLEGSSVLRDPGHLRKLLHFAGISEEDQYASTLHDDVALPTVFPEWAYAEELKASQKEILKARERQKSKVPHEIIDFVSATQSGTSSGAGTPSGKALGQGAAQKLGAGVNEGKANVSSSHVTGNLKELEHRSRDNSQSRNRLHSRSRSPKRRRSKSKERL